MSTYNLQGGVKAQASISVSARVKHNFSKQHLRAATWFADDAQKCEAMTKQPDEEHRSRHRACVTATVLSAVAFLEASVNEPYLSAVDQDQTNLPTFDHALFQFFGQFWENIEKYPILQSIKLLCFWRARTALI